MTRAPAARSRGRGWVAALAVVGVSCATTPPQRRPRGHVDLLSSLAEDPRVTGLVQLKREDGEVQLVGGPGYVRFPFEVESFHLHLTALLESGASAAVVVRGQLGAFSLNGPRVVLSDDDDAPTGSILDGPRSTAATPPPNTWFEVDLKARRGDLTVLVNGKLAAKVRLNPGAGFVALEGRRPGGVARFRVISLDVLD